MSRRDRQHFVLEGVGELQEELKHAAIRYATHVHREGHRQRPICSMAYRACLIIAEEPFCVCSKNCTRALSFSNILVRSPQQYVLRSSCRYRGHTAARFLHLANFPPQSGATRALVPIGHLQDSFTVTCLTRLLACSQAGRL